MASESKKATILIVDDMPINIQVLAGGLKELYHIKIATNGEKALEICADVRPDLVLLDIMMPGMDGYEVLRQMKDNVRTMDIPVIFVTAKGEVEDETNGLNMGAVDYITKPFQLPVVLARIKTQLILKQRTELLERMVFIDGLTLIPNRRWFDDTLEKEWGRAIRNQTPLSLIMSDIDHFKMYNDNYGHAVGDDCLRAVAAQLDATLKRSSDFVARYGGEEFVFILPGLNNDEAAALAEKIRADVEALNIVHAYSPVSDHATLSMGVATLIPKKDSNSRMLIDMADTLLYKAKNEGRNRVKAMDTGKQ
ncbi:MAG TPA: diguanylate cyclase response regulator [Desulfobacteraceae bacterium]|nr:diguanylate cyclase response regulator [Desulfobacteraceae bacterium]